MDLPDFLTRTEYGGIRVAGHRVGLEHIVELYREGRSAEMIALDFPTLPLATIHRTLAFYLDHREEVDRYVAEGHEGARQLMERMNRERPGPTLPELAARRDRRSGVA